MEVLVNVALCRVKWSQYHGLSRVIFDNRILCSHQHLFHEWVINGRNTLALFFIVVVFKLTYDFLLFVFTKNLHELRFFFLLMHPWVIKNLLRRQSFLWICLQYLLEHVESRLCYLSGLTPLALDAEDLLLEFNHICSLKWHRSIKHGVEYYSCAPNIRLESFIALPSKDLRSNIGRSTALFSLLLTCTLDQFTDSKVTYLDVTFRSQQDIVEFDVSVEDILRVHVLKAFDDLFE